MTRSANRLCRCAPWIAACLVWTSCAVLRPGFRAPVEPFAQPLAGVGDLARRIEKYQAPIGTLNAQLQVLAQGGDVRGKQKFTLLMLYRSPDCVKLKATGMVAGGLFEVTLKGAEVSLYFQREGRFYRGALSELEGDPRALNGVRPMDVVRALLVSQEVAEWLRRVPAGRELAASDDRHWALNVAMSPTRNEVFAIRRADGLVEEAGVYDSTGHEEVRLMKVSVVYRRYAYFDGRLLPSRFELFFADTGLRLRVDLQKARPNVDLPEARFSLDPPKELAGDVKPLSEWLKRLQPPQPGSKAGAHDH